MAVPSRTSLLSSKTYEKAVLQSDDPINTFWDSVPKEYRNLMVNMEPKERMYFDYMVRQKNMPTNHALGMLANIKREVQSLNPKEPSGDKGGGPGGLFQWSKSSGRQTPEVAKMVKAGDWKAQIDYAIYEEDVYGKPGAYLKEKFKSAEDAEKWWRVNWENPSDPEAEKKGKSHLKRYKKGGEVFRLDKPLGDY
tara:strand:- start:49 stop:630 length:582 start_codon:yes stop_codon:yes gene_type:complete